MPARWRRGKRRPAGPSPGAQLSAPLADTRNIRRPSRLGSPPDGRLFLNRRPHRTGRNITAILLEAGVVTDEQVERGVLRQRETGLRIGETLVESGAVTEEDVGWALSRQLGLTLVDIDPASLDSDLVHSFKESLLRRSDAVPLLREDDGVSFAVADPTDHEMLDRLEEAAGAPVGLCVGTPSAIRRALDAIFGSAHAPQPSHAVAHHAGGGHVAGATATATPEGKYDVVWERSGATFVAFHLASALKLGASELHFAARDGQLFVSYRQGEALLPIATEPVQVLDALVARLESLGGPVLGDRLHAAGAIECPLPTGDLLVEVSLLRAEDGVHVALKPRPMASTVPSLEALGFEASEAAELRALVESRAGLVLVCGPRGSGCSFALAALHDAAGPAHARTIAFEPAAIVPLPGAARIHVPVDAARAGWQEIVTGQAADIVILDGLVDGPAVSAVLSPAGSRRLMLVRSDWMDSFALLEHLMAQPQGRVILVSRLLAVVQMRRVAEGQAPLVEALFLGPSLREAITTGAARNRMLEVAHATGFRSLAERARARVAKGTLTERDALRALS